MSKGAGCVSGLGDSDGLCVAAHSRATSVHCKGAGCRPPLPLSFATHSQQSVGAGHARPSTLPLPPMYLLPLWPASPPAPPDLKHKKSPPSGCGSGWGLGVSVCVRRNHVPELRLRLRNPVPIYYRITAKKLCFSYEQFVNYRAAGPNAPAAPFFAVLLVLQCRFAV